MLAMQQEQSQKIRTRFNPNESLFIQDKGLAKNDEKGLTFSSFGAKASPSATFGKVKSKSPRVAPKFPTYPNEKAKGLI